MNDLDSGSKSARPHSQVSLQADLDAPLMNSVLDSMIDNVAVITRDGTIVAVNEAWREFGERNGASSRVIDGVGLSHLACLTSGIDPPSKLTVGMESVLSGAAATYELDYPCDSPDEVRWFRMAISRLQNSSERFVVIHRDVTRQIEEERERARTESLISHAVRMESVERIAGGVAHEFNNMLGVILGHAEHALDNDSSRLDRVDDVVQIQRAAQRSALLVRHLLTFSRRQMVAPRHVDVSAAIAALLPSLEQRVGSGVSLTFSPTPDTCTVEIDPAQLELVLTNLCLNSCDALQGEGWIHISTACESFEQGEPDESTAKYVRLSVTDNGPGIAVENMPYVFDPFFTTRAFNEHAGLGLATIHGAVTQVGGFVEIDSSRSTGTRIDVWIPRIDASDTPAGLRSDDAGVSVAEAAQVAAGPQTVLVVDDEQLLLDLTARILRRAGWAVLTAESAEAAMTIALNDDVKFDLLLTDVVLPGMDGPTLVRTLAESGRPTPFLLMSGYTAAALDPGMLDGQFFIAKPFTGKALTEKVQSVLVNAV